MTIIIIIIIVIINYYHFYYYFYYYYFHYYYAVLKLSHRQLLMPRYSSSASYNQQSTAKRMLSPYMSQTFLSILAVPIKADFCTIPTFDLIPSVSLHSLKPLLMHPTAPKPVVKPPPFSATTAFSALSSNSEIFQSFRFLFHVSYNHLLQQNQ